MAANRSVTANWVAIPTSPFNVTKAGTGAGTIATESGQINCGERCAATFYHGTSLTVTATPAPGSFFEGWGGACSGSGPTCTVTISGPTTVSATFVRPTLAIVGTGAKAAWRMSRLNGTLTVKGNASHGAELTITLTRNKRKQIYKVNVGSGAFTKIYRLPRRLEPGRYRLQIEGNTHGVALETVLRHVTLKAPPEGVVRRGWGTNVLGGKPMPALKRGAKELWVVFEWAAKPSKGRLITIACYLNGKHIGTQPAQQKKFVAVAGIVDKRGLPSATYRCVIRAGDTRVSQVAIRVR